MAEERLEKILNTRSPYEAAGIFLNTALYQADKEGITTYEDLVQMSIAASLLSIAESLRTLVANSEPRKQELD